MRLIDADALWMEIIHTMDYCDDILEIIEHQKTIEPTHHNASNTLKTLDCVGRQQAIDAVKGIGRLATLPDNDAVVRMSAVEYVLFNMPSAQPKQGHWTDKSIFYGEEGQIDMWQTCQCSECKRWDTRPHMYYFDEPNYCSHCGAKMQKGKQA